MTGVLVGVLGLALIDSLNPSALAVTIYLLSSSERYVARILVYVSGIVFVYFGVGVLLVLGLDAAVSTVGGYLHSSVSYVLQAVVGVVLLVYGLFPPGGKNRKPKDHKPRSLRYPAVFVLGVVISLVEFSTAFPYLAAVGIISTSGLEAYQWLPILFVYNLIMIAPPLLLMAAYSLFGGRIRPALERFGGRMQSEVRKSWLWLLQAGGALLILNSLHHFQVEKLI
jgi:cytochrome c biogenesis protein CcdA